MDGSILNYLTAIAGNLPPEIISPAVYSQITEMAGLFRDFAAREYIMESHLDSEGTEVDFSFQVLVEEKECLINGLNNSRLTEDQIWRKVAQFVTSWPTGVEDIWLEMDYGEYKRTIPRPCFFFNARGVKKGHELDDNLLFNILSHLLDTEQLKVLLPELKKVAQCLPADVGFFQLGVMLARNNDRIRVFTDELTKEQTLEYLKNIGWSGSHTQFKNILLMVDNYSDGKYILDFDLSEQGISAKIGLNFGLAKEEYLPDFLNCLAQHDMCKETKSKGILAWAGSKGAFLGKDYGYAALVKDISHYKISFTPETAPKAKAYLRFAGVYLKELSTRFPFKNVQPTDNKGQLGAKELQNIFKQLAQKTMLDRNFRELCLKDSQEAIKSIAQTEQGIPTDIVFLEEDGGGIPEGFTAFVLPPYLKQSWLLSKPQKDV